ncbi:MAG: Na+:solute symporter [Acidobacteria bacterium]|nr:Na+:solute symporter [Acidobacteriota bacterium]
MTSLHLTAPDYVVILGYFLVVLSLGLYFNKRQAASKDYFAGGHQVPWWLAGISHYMSSFSAFTFIAYSQIAYTFGWVAITLFWASAPACAMGGLLFAKRWRRARVITPVEFLEKRFTAPLRQLFAWAGIPVKIFDDALKIFATALILATGMGTSVKTTIIVCGAVTVTYTILGGLWALVVTDYVQFLMKIAAMVLLLPLAMYYAGGPVEAFRGLPPGFLHLTGGPYGWTYVLSFILLITISYNGTWALAQKYYSVPDERSASKAAYLSAALNFVGTPLMLLPAIIGRKLLPDLIAQHRTADTYILLVLQLLPVGMVGIIVAAMFSATMAAISADLNAIASVLTRDFYLRVLRPESSEKTLVRVGRLFTALLGVIVIALSIVIAVSHQESLFHTMVTVFGLLLAPTLLPVLGGLTLRWLTWRGALSGFVLGLLCSFTTFSLKTWYFPHVPGISTEWANYTFEGISICLNIAGTLLGMWLGSVLPKKDPAEQQRIREFFRALDTPIRPEEAPKSGSGGEGPALGAATVVVGLLLMLAGVVASSPGARWTDLAAGAALAAFGARFLVRARQRARAGR